MTIFSEFRELFNVIQGEDPEYVPLHLINKFLAYHYGHIRKNPMWLDLFSTKRKRLENRKYAFPRGWLSELLDYKQSGYKRRDREADQEDVLSDMMKRSRF